MSATDRRSEGYLSAEIYATLMTDSKVIAFIKDVSGRYIYANAFLIKTFGEQMPWEGRTDTELWPPAVAADIRTDDVAVLQTGSLHMRAQVMPFPDGPHDVLVLKFPLASAPGDPRVGGLGIDLTERSVVEAEHRRLTTAVEQVAESVVITDVDARITYVNPAFERVTGYKREEVIGRNPRFLKSGQHGVGFYLAMWAALSNGTPWVTDMVNRRKDGSLFTEEAVISAIRAPTGEISGYVAVNRDVTAERAAEVRSSEFARERALIAETLRNVKPRDSAESTAQIVCRQLLGLSGVTAAQLYIFELDGRAMPIGFAVADEPDPPLRRLPHQRSRHLRERASEGPWIEPWVHRPWHPYNALLVGLGVHLAAYAPLRWGGTVIGLLVLDATESTSEEALSNSLGALVEFADLSAALIGDEVASRVELVRARSRIHSIIERQLFHPVFQPIVELDTRAIVGHEALTRFDDHVPPDVRFGEAAAVGLGLELERATLGAALTAASALPSGWLNLNASPALIEAGRSIGPLLRGRGRRIVLEVTEHAEIADYSSFKARLTMIRPRVELAIDDAGAGFASLRHILELQPAFIKLDRSLVEGIETDLARQALVVGLRHFARETDCRLIAEGIETAEQLAVLRSLEIEFGQGYLLGRPEPVASR